jgi:hypothetical protein
MRAQRWFSIRASVLLASAVIVTSAAIAVSAMPAAGAAIGRVTPASAAAKIPTVLSLAVAGVTVTPQQSYVALRGQLQQAKTTANPFAPVKHEIVSLERRFPNKPWRLVRSKRTEANGIVNFRVHLARGTNPKFRLVFRGTAKYGRSVSNVQSP